MRPRRMPKREKQYWKLPFITPWVGGTGERNLLTLRSNSTYSIIPLESPDYFGLRMLQKKTLANMTQKKYNERGQIFSAGSN